MKILTPDVSGKLVEMKEGFAQFVYRLREEQEDAAGWKISGAELEEEDLTGLTFRECIFENCRLIGCNLERISLIRSEWISCDLSGSHLPDGYFHRCRFTGCKAMGTDFYQGNFQEVILQSCNLQYTNWDQSKMKNMAVEDCDCTRSVFSDCRIKNILWKNSRLEGVNFFKTWLRGMDFTTCQLEGITVSDTFEELRGAKVTNLQALELSRLLGIELIS